MVYGNYQQPQFQYNPYYGQYGYQNYSSLQNQMQPQQQLIPQIQQPQNQQQSVQQPVQNVLQGWYVDSFDVTKAINADMSGTAMFFPSTDGKEIYKKQLDVNTGKSDTLIYKLTNQIQQEEKSVDIDFSQVYECIADVKKELTKSISELKEMVLDSITSPVVSQQRKVVSK